jgi:hypothetical protein
MNGCVHASTECEWDPQRQVFQLDYTKPDGENRRFFCKQHISAAAVRRLKYVTAGPFTITPMPEPFPGITALPTDEILLAEVVAKAMAMKWV